MTENVWAFLIAVVVAIPPTLTVLFTHFAQQRERKQEVKETNATLNSIHTAVNSNMAAAEARIATGQEKLEKMQEDALAAVKAAAQIEIARLQALVPPAKRR